MWWMLAAGAATLSGGGVDLTWAVEGRVLTAEVTAKTTGWVCAGFHDEPGLKGTSLILGAAVGEKSRVEEHLADPPNHAPVEALGARLLESDVVESSGRTTVRFRWRLRDDWKAGDTVYVTLAWSHEDDFGHHSARRVHRTLVL